MFNDDSKDQPKTSSWAERRGAVNKYMQIGIKGPEKGVKVSFFPQQYPHEYVTPSRYEK